MNLNGRISLIYSVFWGLLGVYLIKVINPKIDYFIDWQKLKFKSNFISKSAVLVMIVFLFLDFLASTFALDAYLTRTTVENNLNVKNFDGALQKYSFYYNDNKGLTDTIYKLWDDKFMVKIYPNVTIRLENGESVQAKDYHKDILPYFYKF